MGAVVQKPLRKPLAHLRAVEPFRKRGAKAVHGGGRRLFAADAGDAAGALIFLFADAAFGGHKRPKCVVLFSVHADPFRKNDTQIV